MSNDEARAYLESVWARNSILFDLDGWVFLGEHKGTDRLCKDCRAAVAFTEARLEEIVSVSRSIEFLSFPDVAHLATFRDEYIESLDGTIARERAVLADLCKGIRAEKLQEMGVEL